MRRTIKIAALAGAGVLMLTACGSGGGGRGEDGDLEATGDITIWHSNNEFEIAWADQMVEAWNADHPDEQIKAQEIPAGNSSEEVIAAAITAGNAPCLIFNTAPAAVPQFEKAGGLVSLSSFEDGDAYIEERAAETRPSTPRQTDRSTRCRGSPTRSCSSTTRPCSPTRALTPRRPHSRRSTSL